MSDASGTSGDVELIQLLTPEGERVEHPEYAFAGDDEQIQSFYRDMVLTRRIDTEAIALQRQGELGIWPSCWARRRPRSAPAAPCWRRTTPSRPTASTAWPGAAGSTRCGCSRCSAASTWAAGTPAEYGFHLYTIVIGAQALHATGYAMGVERDGWSAPATRIATPR